MLNRWLLNDSITTCLHVFVLLSIFVRCGSVRCAADDWPFLRGPRFDGYSQETDIANDWPEEGPPVLWVRKLGQGYSAFVAVEDRVYTQAQNITGQYLYCLDADTGETIWEYRYDWPYEAAGVYPGPRSTPTVYEGHVFFTSPDGLLACVDAATGELQWSVDLLATYGIEGCDFGYACSPTVINDKVILPVGGKDAGVVAFDFRTGRELWKSTSEPASYTPAYPIELNGEALVVAYMQNCLLILDQDTGKVRYESKLSTGYDEHSAWPIYQEPFLWLSSPFRAGCYCLDLSGLNDETVSEAWRTKMMSNDVCSCVMTNGHIFGFDIKDVQSKTHRPSRGTFRCLNFETGQQTWSVGTGQPRRASNAAEYANDILQSGIIVADGKLIVFNELGELILLKADTEKCVELARCTVLGGEITWTPPCLSNGRLFVRNQDRAVCVYLGDPQRLDVATTQTVSDLPQREYHNFSMLVLAVEPEYVFDIPNDRWLVMWCLAGAVILVFAKLLTFFGRQSSFICNHGASIELMVALALGVLGTTALGHITGEFLFTWHVCLYASCEYVAVQSFPRESNLQNASGIQKRIPMLILLGVCYLFYAACLRLSLVFEWAFMIGFPGALLILWPAYRFQRLQPKSLINRLFVTLLAYSCFYTFAVAFLKSRY